MTIDLIKATKNNKKGDCMTVQTVKCERHNKSFHVMQTTTKAMNICHICNIEKLRKETV